MKSILLLRRVVGKSMYPMLRPGQLVLATGLFRTLYPGQVVIVEHDHKQKVKRIERIKADKVFVIGDNLGASTDSRHFGWLGQQQVVARVLFPRLAK